MLNLGPRPTSHTTAFASRAATMSLCIALMLAFLAAITPDALAGTYVVTACGAAPGGVNNSWVAHSNHGNVTTYATPCAPVSGGLIARAAANASSVPSGTYATWNFNSPNASTVITGVDVSAEIFRLGGDAFNNWGVGLYDETGGYLWGGAGAGYLHVGTQSGSYIPIGVNNRAAIAIGALCLNGGGCSTASSGVQEMTLSAPDAPPGICFVNSFLTAPGQTWMRALAWGVMRPMTVLSRSYFEWAEWRWGVVLA